MDVDGESSEAGEMDVDGDEEEFDDMQSVIEQSVDLGEVDDDFQM